MSFIGGDYGPSTPNGSKASKVSKPTKPKTTTYTNTTSATNSVIKAAKPQESVTGSNKGGSNTGSKEVKKTTTKNKAVKVATSNLFITEQPKDNVDEMTALLFEDFGAVELISLARHDTLNGQDVVYQPIQNLTQLSFDYSPQNILASAKTDADLTGNFLIDISKYIPGEPSNPEIVYLDSATNDIIIETINVREDERIEVEFLTYTTVEDDTIYTT